MCRLDGHPRPRHPQPRTAPHPTTTIGAAFTFCNALFASPGTASHTIAADVDDAAVAIGSLRSTSLLLSRPSYAGRKVASCIITNFERSNLRAYAKAKLTSKDPRLWAHSEFQHPEDGGHGHSPTFIETTAVFPVWYGRLGIYVSQTLIGDVFMIYRLFIVWNRSKKIIVLPATLCLVNAVCGYLTLGPLTTTFILLGFILLSLVSNVLCSVLIIWRVLRSANQSTPFAVRLKLYQKVAEAIVQSAAIYSTASIALGLTFFFNPNNKPGFLVCLAVFPPLIGLVFSFIVLRMARSSAEDAARRSSHTGNGGADKRHTIITPNRRPLSVQLHMPPFPPPAFHLATLDFPEHTQAMESSNASTNSVKPTEPLTRNNSSLTEDRRLDSEGPLGECILDVLDRRTSKSSWSEPGGLGY